MNPPSTQCLLSFGFNNDGSLYDTDIAGEKW